MNKRTRRRRRANMRKKGNGFVISNQLKMIIGGGIASVILLVILISVFTGRNKTFVAQNETISFVQDATGIVVRSEKLYKAENYGRTEFIASEGQTVSSGTPIADVYGVEYNAKDYLNLKSLQEKIMDYQENHAQTDIIDDAMVALNARIATTTDTIRAIVSGEEGGDLNQLERDLSRDMTERANLLKTNTKEDDSLTAMYTEEETLLTKLATHKKTIVAEEEGVVSFYFDGIETLLVPEHLEELTVKNINAILQGKTSEIAEETFAARPLYRLVDKNLWYVVFVSDKAVPEFETDASFKIAFSHDSNFSYTASIDGHREDKGKHIYYLKFTEDVSTFLWVRQVTFSVSSDYTGLSVSKKVIKEKDGVQGVYWKKDEEKVFEPIEILIKDKERMLIIPVNKESGLVVGVEIYE
ncbi:MAG: HlyD family efflux transporter periplasmic adaptor subunit [Christensenellaceae bacterium]